MSDQSLESEIADLLEDWGIGTVGTDIFIGDLPDNITAGMFLVTSPSPEPHSYIDTEYHAIDFYYLHSKYQLAYDKLRDVFMKLNRRHNYETNNWYIYFTKVLNGISDQDRTREGGKLLRLGVLFTCRNKNTIS